MKGPKKRQSKMGKMPMNLARHARMEGESLAKEKREMMGKKKKGK